MTISQTSRAACLAVVALALASSAITATAAAAPAIRTTADNRVPACVSPDKLMAFLTDRNQSLDPRFRDIARWYQHWGDAWRVRWDYAFFQMALETNYLKYRRGDGRRGDVHEKQNNFAGIGATGGGVPGDRFPDIKTGVHAQIQHLVAYSGERLAEPIAPRTQLKQDDIIDQSRRLRRPVTFGDLARRWAADRKYAKSIDFVADQFRTRYCTGTAAAGIDTVPKPQPARRTGRNLFAPPSGLGGPKPLRLAGPDELPWAKSSPSFSAPEPPAAMAPNEAVIETPPQPQSPRAPVRTIWSRSGTADEPAAPAKSLHNQAKPARPATIAAQTPAQATPAQATSEANESAPLLPTFKISPATPQPSRLGGPLPSARFGEIVTTPAPAVATIGPCKILTASYGGKKTLLVRSALAGETRYTALTVLDGFEKSMFDIYTKATAPPNSPPNSPQAEIVGEYPSQDAALADARANCPGG